MNFLTALTGTCKGTKIFSQLLYQPLLRTFMHLLLLVFCCSIFILACTYYPNSHKVDETFSEIKNLFGDINVSKEGILPATPDKTKSMLVANNSIRLSYIPAPDKNSFSDIDADEVNSGFIWTPTMISLWVKTGSDNFTLAPFTYFSKEPLFPEEVKRPLIATYIKNNSSLENELISQFPALNWQSLNDYFKASFISLLFMSNLIGISLQVLFFVAMFSFILNLSRGNKAIPVLKYKQRFVIGIYASFPPLLIASMFSAFELPYLSFNSVYVICFSIYLITVYTRLQLEYNSNNQIIK
jgi:hypothetical protein